MPAGGTPVASMITSMSGQAISAAASSVIWVRRLDGVAERGRRGGGDVPTGRRQLSRARATSRSAMPTTCRSVRTGSLGEKHGAELAGADQPDRHRPADRLPLHQHGMKIYRSPPLAQTRRERSTRGGDKQDADRTDDRDGLLAERARDVTFDRTVDGLAPAAGDQRVGGHSSAVSKSTLEPVL